MNGPKTFTNYGFQISVLGVIVVALLIASAASVDLVFGLKWGFSSRDILMAIIVVVGALILRVVGTKIISAFGGGI